MNKRILFLIVGLIEAKKVVFLDMRNPFPQEVDTADETFPITGQTLAVMTLDTDTQKFTTDYYAQKMKRKMIFPGIKVTTTSAFDSKPEVKLDLDNETLLVLGDNFKGKLSAKDADNYISKDLYKKFVYENDEVKEENFGNYAFYCKNTYIPETEDNLLATFERLYEDSLTPTGQIKQIRNPDYAVRLYVENKIEPIKLDLLTKTAFAADSYKADNQTDAQEEKGFIGEILSSMNMWSAFCTQIDSKYGSNNGVDGIFKGENKRIYYIESKCDTKHWTQEAFSAILNDETYKNKIKRYNKENKKIAEILEKAKDEGNLNFIGQWTRQTTEKASGILITTYQRKPEAKPKTFEELAKAKLDDAKLKALIEALTTMGISKLENISYKLDV